MAEPPPTPRLDVLEFFAGIGGLHYALRRTGVPHQVRVAYDQDTAAAATYRHNIPDTQVSTVNLRSLSASDLRAACGSNDLWLLSPPCQPYTRQGHQLAAEDHRAGALEHLLDLFEADSSLLPAALLLENVVGFESSASRRRLHAVLTEARYCVREVWASPAMIGVPNQRTRYFLLARRGADSMDAALPARLANVTLLSPSRLTAACAPDGEPLEKPCGEVASDLMVACAPLGDYLEPAGDAALAAHAVPEHVLERYGASMDLVGRHSRRSLCVTKNYARYVKGTGSILCEALEPTATAPRGVEEKTLAVLAPLRPRYLAPAEVARLHGFPPSLAFPPEVGRKKQYELLGNSLSVDVVAALLTYLLRRDIERQAPDESKCSAPGADA